jgi:flagellar biosynthesis protein FlhB
VADEEEEDKSEEPSARRLQHAWDEGQVPLGRDAALVASLAGAAGALYVVARALRGGLVHAVASAAGTLDATPFRTLPGLALGPAAAAAAVCAAAAAAAIVATLAQTKGGVWPQLPFPDLSRLANPGRITKIFSKEGLSDLGLAAAKVVALGGAAWTTVRGDFLTLRALLDARPPDQLARAFEIVLRAGSRMLLAAVILAGVDLALTRIRFSRKMRMTKAEARRETREDDGDPLLKGKRKKRHRELSRGRAAMEVPRADALVVNPTHVAIALRYRKDEGRAPRVIAKGKGALAEYMRDLARENAIPIVQDIPLARLLYKKVKVGHEVPAATYKAVAAVLAFVYRITGRAPGGRAQA